MDADLVLKAELVATFALYSQGMVEGTPTVEEVARLTHSTFHRTMRFCEEALEFALDESFPIYVQALTEFWAGKLDVASSDLLVEQDSFCRPAAEPSKW